MTYIIYDPYETICRCGHAFKDHSIMGMYHDECHGDNCDCALFVAERFIPKGTIGNG